MSDQDILNNAIARIQQRETQQPLFSKRPPVPHLKPATQEQPRKVAPKVTNYVTRGCKFCGHECHGDFALAQHLSEHTTDPNEYVAKTANRYNKYRLDALQILHRGLVADYTEDERLDAMVECDKFSSNYSYGCNGEYVDGGRPHAWVIHILRKHDKKEMVDQFSKEDWEEFKVAYNKAIPALERAYSLVRGHRTIR